MKKYLLIKPDEDGKVCTFIEDLEDLLKNPLDYGIKNFYKEIPSEEDPQYWPEENALLLEIKVLKPKPTAYKYRLEDNP